MTKDEEHFVWWERKVDRFCTWKHPVVQASFLAPPRAKEHDTPVIHTKSPEPRFSRLALLSSRTFLVF